MKTTFQRLRLTATFVFLAGIATANAETITIDFGRQTAESSYLLFGAASPNPRHTAAWEKLAPAGVTSLRFDCWLGNGTEPRNITLEDYRANMGRKGSVADINSSHWNWSRVDGCLALCEKHGLLPVVIICYSPRWLSYTGEKHSPPRDFAVWKDIVRQIVLRYQGRVRHWEIWNEPNGPNFMKTARSPYPTGKDGMLAAYHDICRHSLDAIKEAGVDAQVGGPVLATWGSAAFLDKFLARADVAGQFGFLSHHIYFHAPAPNRCHPPTIRELERKHGVGPLPLFITEWNCSSGVDENPHPLKNSPAAVGWVGKSFINFLQWGVQGAHFYNFHEGRKLDDQFGGAYRMIDGEPQLFRFVKVFHLLSKVLGLGERGGKISVFDSHVAGLPDEMTLEPLFVDSLYAAGCMNARLDPVIVIANPSARERTADLSANQLPVGSYRIAAHIAHPDHTPAEAITPTLLFERTVQQEDGRLVLSVPVPAHSVIGLRLTRLP